MPLSDIEIIPMSDPSFWAPPVAADPQPKTDEEPLDLPAAAAVEDEALEGGGQTDLYISLLDDEGDFRAGELVTIRIRVGSGRAGTIPVQQADVTVKVLGTTFRPLILTTKTSEDGTALVRALLPRFTSGRAAILIRAQSNSSEAEMRRIIHHA